MKPIHFLILGLFAIALVWSNSCTEEMAREPYNAKIQELNAQLADSEIIQSNMAAAGREKDRKIDSLQSLRPKIEYRYIQAKEKHKERTESEAVAYFADQVNEPIPQVVNDSVTISTAAIRKAGQKFVELEYIQPKLANLEAIAQAQTDRIGIYANQLEEMKAAKETMQQIIEEQQKQNQTTSEKLKRKSTLMKITVPAAFIFGLLL